MINLLEKLMQITLVRKCTTTCAVRKTQAFYRAFKNQNILHFCYMHHNFRSGVLGWKYCKVRQAQIEQEH